MQEKCKLILEEQFPNLIIRESDDNLKFNKSELTGDDLNKLSHVEGMYKDILIKRSGVGVVVIMTF